MSIESTPLDAAVALAVHGYSWAQEDAEAISLTFLSAAPDFGGDPAELLRDFAKRFPGPRPWHEQVRELVAECGHVTRRIAARVRSVPVLQAIVVLCNRKLGIGLLEGIARLRPARGLVAVLDLPEETLKAISPCAVEGQTKSPGWFIARVLFLPDPAPPGLAVGDKVLVEDRCQPDGAGYIPSEEFGLKAGGRVILVPCVRRPTAARSEELAERLKEVQAFKAKYPPAQFPRTHSLWKTPEGEALLAQQGEHAFQMQRIMRERRGCARNKLIKAGKDDVTLPDGIIGVVED